MGVASVNRFFRTRLNTRLGIFVLLWSVAPAGLTWAESESPVGNIVSETIQQGLNAYRRNNFDRAEENLLKAEKIASSNKELSDQTLISRHLANVYFSMGRYSESVERLKQILTRKAQNDLSSSERINVQLALGRAYERLGQQAKSRQILDEGIEQARILGNNQLIAAGLNDLGVAFYTAKDSEKAIAIFLESARYSALEKNHLSATKAFINAGKAINGTELTSYNARDFIASAQAHLKQTPRSNAKTMQWISLAQLVQYYLHDHPDDAGVFKRKRFEWLTDAYQVAEDLKDTRSKSYALGYLAGLYEEKKRYDDALVLNDRALLNAEKIKAPEIQYLWLWQKARFLRDTGKTELALTAYTNAVDTLNPIRLSLLARERLPTRFSKNIGALYLELTQLLLDKSSQTTSLQEQTDLLNRARGVVEQYKVAEIENFFNDDCLASYRNKQRSIDEITPHTAVIYPILFEEKTEILVSTREGVFRFTINKSRPTLNASIQSFRQTLEDRRTYEFRPQAKILYDWLIRPLEGFFRDHSIETLVFVPDGALRTVPMAALYDGNHYLIEKFAIATTPGFNLTAPNPLAKSSLQILAAGLTQSVQGFPALTAVAKELSTLEKNFDAHILKNRDFNVQNVQNSLRENPYSIVHIASHGSFGGDPKASYILAFDEQLTTDRFERIIAVSQFRDKPLELLTLSACETARGDDNAALGLAGITIKAGARSVLATLWQVNDSAAGDLAHVFYHKIIRDGVSKAQALRSAQLQLINNESFEHPYYWSPFILIGNWL